MAEDMALEGKIELSEITESDIEVTDVVELVSGIIETEDGTYQDAGYGDSRRKKNLRRYTAFLSYMDGPEGEPVEIDEEIDVDAFNRDHAELITKAAMELHYDEDLRILRIEERHGLYL
jgi:hypothetical protein